MPPGKHGNQTRTQGGRRLPGYDFSTLPRIDAPGPGERLRSLSRQRTFINAHTRETRKIMFPPMPTKIPAGQELSPDETKQYMKDLFRRDKLYMHFEESHEKAEKEVPVPVLDHLLYRAVRSGGLEGPTRIRPFWGTFHPKVGMSLRAWREWVRDMHRPKYVKGAHDPYLTDNFPQMSDLVDPGDYKAFFKSKAQHGMSRSQQTRAAGLEMPMNDQDGSALVQALGIDVIRDKVLAFLPENRHRAKLARLCQKTLALANHKGDVSTWKLQSMEFNHCEKDEKECQSLSEEEQKKRRVASVLMIDNPRAEDEIDASTSNPDFLQEAYFDRFGKMMTALHFFRNSLRVLHMRRIPLLDADAVAIIVKSAPRLEFMGIYRCELINFSNMPRLLDLIAEATRPSGLFRVDGVVPDDRKATAPGPPGPERRVPVRGSIDLDIFPAFWDGPDSVSREGCHGLFWNQPGRSELGVSQLTGGIIGTYLCVIEKGHKLGIDFTRQGCAMRTWIESIPFQHGLAIHLVDLGCRFKEILKYGLDRLSEQDRRQVLHSLDNHMTFITLPTLWDNSSFQTPIMTPRGSPVHRRPFTCAHCRRTAELSSVLTVYEKCSMCFLAFKIQRDECGHHLLAKKREVIRMLLEPIKWDPDTGRPTQQANVAGSKSYVTLKGHWVTDLAEVAQNYKLHKKEADEYVEYLVTLKCLHLKHERMSIRKITSLVNRLGPAGVTIAKGVSLFTGYWTPDQKNERWTNTDVQDLQILQQTPIPIRYQVSETFRRAKMVMANKLRSECRQLILQCLKSSSTDVLFQVLDVMDEYKRKKDFNFPFETKQIDPRDLEKRPLDQDLPPAFSWDQLRMNAVKLNKNHVEAVKWRMMKQAPVPSDCSSSVSTSAEAGSSMGSETAETKSPGSAISVSSGSSSSELSRAKLGRRQQKSSRGNSYRNLGSRSRGHNCNNRSSAKPHPPRWDAGNTTKLPAWPISGFHGEEPLHLKRVNSDF